MGELMNMIIPCVGTYIPDYLLYQTVIQKAKLIKFGVFVQSGNALFCPAAKPEDLLDRSRLV